MPSPGYTLLEAIDESVRDDSEHASPPQYMTSTNTIYSDYKLKEGFSKEGYGDYAHPSDEQDYTDIPAGLILVGVTALCILSTAILAVFSVTATYWGYILLQHLGRGAHGDLAAYIPIEPILAGSAAIAAVYSVIMGLSVPVLVTGFRDRGLFPLVRGAFDKLAMASIFVSALGISLLSSQAPLDVTGRDLLELSALGTAAGVLPLGSLVLYRFKKSLDHMFSA